MRTTLLRRVRRPTVVLILGALLLHVAASALLFSVGWVPRLEALGGVTLPDNQLGYAASDLYIQLTAYGDAGRQLYSRYLLLVDPLYAALTALTVSLVILYLTGAVPRLARWGPRLLLLPGALLVLDLLENGGMLLVLQRYPTPLPRLVGLLSLLTSLKIVLVNLALLLVPLGLLALAARALVRRRRTPSPLASPER